MPREFHVLGEFDIPTGILGVRRGLRHLGEGNAIKESCARKGVPDPPDPFPPALSDRFLLCYLTNVMDTFSAGVSMASPWAGGLLGAAGRETWQRQRGARPADCDYRHLNNGGYEMNTHFGAFDSVVRLSYIALLLALLIPCAGAKSRTDIFKAVLSGQVETVRTMLRNDPGLACQRAKKDITPLHLAAYLGATEVAELLLASHADVNAQTKDHLTPLHLAAANGRTEMVKLLIANKADVNAREAKGFTPLQLAVSAQHDDVAELLRQHAAEEVSSPTLPSGVGPLSRQPELEKAAQYARYAPARLVAVRELFDLPLLEKVAAKDKDDSVRSAAAERESDILKRETSKEMASGILKEALSILYRTPHDWRWDVMDVDAPPTISGVCPSRYLRFDLSFGSLYEDGYDFTEAPNTIDSRTGYQIGRMIVANSKEMGPAQQVLVRFADVAEIQVAHAPAGRVCLLSASRRVLAEWKVPRGGLLDTVVTALRVLCPNSKYFDMKLDANMRNCRGKR